jgi:hypothetical protein
LTKRASTPRAALGILVAIELVGEGYRHHLDARELLRRHLAHRAIERFRPDEERAVQRHAIDLALENTGVDQAEKRLDQHFADPIKPLRERRALRGAAPGASRFMMAWNCALSRWRTISPCASASPTWPMPICKVPPSGTRPLHEARSRIWCR